MSEPAGAQLLEINDWNGTPLTVGGSRGGVLAAADVRRNLLLAPETVWPPAALKPKLKASRQIGAFDPDAATALSAFLGFYCDLQSLRSEDAITWSFFGPLIETRAAQRAHLLDWLLDICGIDCQPNTECEIALWRRLPHPDTGRSAHGPEPDFALIGDHAIVLGEAKWGAKEDTKQGVLGTTSQMDMRRGSLAALEKERGGSRRLVALGIVQTQTLEPARPDSPGMTTRIIEWSRLVDYQHHPLGDEFARYLSWKAQYGTNMSPRR